MLKEKPVAGPRLRGRAIRRGIPEVKEVAVAERREPCMTRRMPGWDYCRPWIYEINLELVDRDSRALGEIVVDAENSEGVPTAAHCELSPLGRRVLECWFAIERFNPECKVLVEQVMPEHFHGIIRVVERLDKPLGQVVNGFKIGCNRAARELRPDVLSSGALPPGTKHHGAGGGLWKEGFCDKPVLRRGQLNNQFEYIRGNPLRRAIKAAAPDLFRRYRDIECRGMHFEALGNHWLLDRPLHQVQCSRAWCRIERIVDGGGKQVPARDENGNLKIAEQTPEFAERLKAMRKAGEEGAAIICPCFSEGERYICNEAYRSGYAVITLKNMGFNRSEKPVGKLFDRCAEGRLLYLAPVAWPYQSAAKALTRLDGIALNRIAQKLAGEGAAEINYKGLVPAQVDEYVREIAKVGGVKD